MKFSEAKKQLAALGITIKKNEYGEFEVNFKGGKEKTCCYTDDLEDAVGTGKAMAARKKAKPVKKFRLIGRTTVFEVVEEKMVAGFIPAVKGHTLDGKFQTTARKADIIFLPA